VQIALGVISLSIKKPCQAFQWEILPLINRESCHMQCGWVGVVGDATTLD